MNPSYYLWSGIGAIEDLNGDDAPLCPTREEALHVLRGKRDSVYDWSLWERYNGKVRLIAISVSEPGSGRSMSSFHER